MFASPEKYITSSGKIANRQWRLANHGDRAGLRTLTLTPLGRFAAFRLRYGVKP